MCGETYPPHIPVKRPAGDHNVTVRRPCPLLTVSRTSVLSLPWGNQCRVSVPPRVHGTGPAREALGSTVVGRAGVLLPFCDIWGDSCITTTDRGKEIETMWSSESWVHSLCPHTCHPHPGSLSPGEWGWHTTPPGQAPSPRTAKAALTLEVLKRCVCRTACLPRTTSW